MSILVLNEDFLNLMFIFLIEIMPEEVGEGNVQKGSNLLFSEGHSITFFDIVNNFVLPKLLYSYRGQFGVSNNYLAILGDFGLTKLLLLYPKNLYGEMLNTDL